MEHIFDRMGQCGFSLDLLAETYPELDILKGVEQNPRYHGEGDVYRHTKLVCREITKLEQWPGLGERQKEALFLAGAFHDIGKPACTRLEMAAGRRRSTPLWGKRCFGPWLTGGRTGLALHSPSGNWRQSLSVITDFPSGSGQKGDRNLTFSRRRRACP